MEMVIGRHCFGVSRIVCLFFSKQIYLWGPDGVVFLAHPKRRFETQNSRFAKLAFQNLSFWERVRVRFEIHALRVLGPKIMEKLPFSE